MSRPDSWAGWLPFSLTAEAVEWGYMGRERFTEPFFQDTRQRLLRRPFNQVFRRRSGLDWLLERAESHPGLPLRGIVFHMSRCGSTLAARWLAALSDSVVLSEPEPFDTLLQWQFADPLGDEAEKIALLRALVSALGQARRPQDRRLFIKPDCWHLCHVERILAAFPAVPWVFLYRDPLEVLVSQQRMPAWYTVPGAMAGHGLQPPDDLCHKPLECGAWVLAHILQGALRAVRQYPNGMLLNYRELPTALETRLARHFSLDLSEADKPALEGVCRHSSKQPGQPFQPDALEKRAAADAALKDISARWLDQPYAALEKQAILVSAP